MATIASTKASRSGTEFTEKKEKKRGEDYVNYKSEADGARTCV